MSTKLIVSAQPDHLQKLTRCKAERGLEELIWNSLDADATKINVSFLRNGLGGLQTLEIEDNGHGITLQEANNAFSKLGGSAKSKSRNTPLGRMLHGKEGQGRYRALSLGEEVVWFSRVNALDGRTETFSITISRENLSQPEISDAELVDAHLLKPGCTVLIDKLVEGADSLLDEDLPLTMASRLAMYLQRNPGISLTIDGISVEPDAVVEEKYEETITGEELGVVKDAALIIYFWKIGSLNEMFFCRSDGVAIEQTESRVSNQGLSFSSFIVSSFFNENSFEGYSGLSDLDPLAATFREKARQSLRRIISQKLAARAADTIEELKAKKAYPYSGEPNGQIERVERTVFDVAAQKIYELSPSLQSADDNETRVRMQVLRVAIEEEPSARQKIIQRVFELSDDKASEFAELLESIDLSSIVSLSYILVERLNFLVALERLVYEPKSKKELLERSQLHKILNHYLWIFGEQYQLGRTDQSLKNVLLEHMRILGRTEPVEKFENSPQISLDRIPDLMLYQQYCHREPGHFEHLIIELKRPGLPLGRKEFDQIMDYAAAVAAHPQFDKETTKWRFVLVGGNVNESDYQQRATGTNKPDGQLEDKSPTYTVEVVKWGTVIQQAKGRHKWLQNLLQFDATNETAAALLKLKHSDITPTHLMET